jgi:putative resolvase
MKLSTWAKSNGLSYKTAWRMWKDGTLPWPAEQLPTGTILIHPPAVPGDGTAVALYARVSSSDQKADLERQLGRLAAYASQHHLSVTHAIGEIGAGLNGHRAKLKRVLADPKIVAIVVEHRDRLARFGADYVEAALAAAGRRLIVIDSSEMNDDLVADMIDIMTSFCARRYGRRAARNRAAKVVNAALSQETT